MSNGLNELKVSSSNEFSGSYKFGDGVCMVEDLQYILCYKLDDTSASVMQRYHLISNTN